MATCNCTRITPKEEGSSPEMLAHLTFCQTSQPGFSLWVRCPFSPGILLSRNCHKQMVDKNGQSTFAHFQLHLNFEDDLPLSKRSPTTRFARTPVHTRLRGMWKSAKLVDCQAWMFNLSCGDVFATWYPCCGGFQQKPKGNHPFWRLPCFETTPSG